MHVSKHWRLMAVLAGVTALLSLGVYFLGFAWKPSGNASSEVLHSGGCSVYDDRVSVDRPPAVEDQWSLYAYDAALTLKTGLGGYGAERYVKAQLPWSVRMRLVWDSDTDVLAAYGKQDDICMLARVVEGRRQALTAASEALPSSGR